MLTPRIRGRGRDGGDTKDANELPWQISSLTEGCRRGGRFRLSGLLSPIQADAERVLGRRSVVAGVFFSGAPEDNQGQTQED